MPQTDHQEALRVYVEKMGVFFGMESRMPRSVSRVLSLLLVSEPAHQSTEEIATKLQLSAGAVNSAVNLLLQVGLVKRVTITGDRHYYYESDPHGWRQTMLLRLKSINHGIALAKEGMELSENNARLQAMHDTYVIFESEIEMLVKRLNV